MRGRSPRHIDFAAANSLERAAWPMGLFLRGRPPREHSCFGTIFKIRADNDAEAGLRQP